MPILTAALAAGGLAILPIELNGAIAAIQSSGPQRLDIMYEGYLPLPVVGTRIKAANASISAWIWPLVIQHRLARRGGGHRRLVRRL